MLNKKVQLESSCDFSFGEGNCLNDDFYFQWHITEKCNLRCNHCYHTEYNSSSELSAADLLKSADKMLDALAMWGKTGSFSITGGEPLIRKDDLFAVTKYLDGKDKAFYYDILSNGTLFDDPSISALTELQKLRRIQLSLEGSCATTNDRIRGEGSFDVILATIRKLKNAGLTVSIMTTIYRSNINEIIPLIDLLENEGVDTFALERFIPEGQGSKMADEALTSDEIHDVFQSVYEVGRHPRRIRVLMYRPLFGILDRDDPTIGAMCSIGTNALTVMHDGTIYPCRRLPIPIGNITKDSLFKIWYDSPILWQIRNPANLKGKCNGCDLVPICRGCRAVAYAKTGDYLAEDPQCWL